MQKVNQQQVCKENTWGGGGKKNLFKNVPVHMRQMILFLRTGEAAFVSAAPARRYGNEGRHRGQTSRQHVPQNIHTKTRERQVSLSIYPRAVFVLPILIIRSTR